MEVIAIEEEDPPLERETKEEEEKSKRVRTME